MRKVKPLIMAHRGGDCFGIENSSSTIKKSLLAGAEIIELDVRKSSNNVLFCFHGNLLHCLIPKFFFNRKYEEIKKRFHSITTLTENALVVGKKAALFLDIKDDSISNEDLLNALRDVKVDSVYVAHRKLYYFRKLGQLPKQWKKIVNLGYSFSKSKINSLVEAEIHAIELFFWHFNKHNVDLLRNKGIDVAIPRMFISKRNYFIKCIQENVLWITGYNLPKLIKKVRKVRGLRLMNLSTF